MNILIVSPHPDDETLGAGGTLIKLKKQGHNLFWLNISDMNVEDGWSKERITNRQHQIAKIKKFYGFKGFYNLAFPPSKLSSICENDIIAKIRSVIEEIKPDWLIIPGQYDAHSDHYIVYNCCMVCAKTFRAPYIKRITTMEIVSETDYGFREEVFKPNLFIDISDELEDKLRAVQLYDTEIEETPFPRSIENIRSLAMFRGGQCNSLYAEAFHIIKQIE